LTPQEKDDVLEALKRIESSKTFGGVPHYLECLRFVVEKTLAGCDAERLSASRLAADLFDGAKKSNVAPEFGRIRLKLLKYYTVEAPTDPVTIEILEGAYVPTFWFSKKSPGDGKSEVPNVVTPPLAATEIDQKQVWDFPPINPFFTGRDKYLERVRESLEKHHSVALTGLAGTGKTQTAIAYAYRYQDRYDRLMWCSAESEGALMSGFAVLSRRLMVAPKDDSDLRLAADRVRGWLQSNSRWLLILDNLEDPSVIRHLAQAFMEGHVLITTQMHATADFGERVELLEMKPAEGALLVLRRAKLLPKDRPLEAASEVDRRLASQISVQVGGLPLALDQVGAFIEETPSTLEESLRFYATDGANLRARRGNLAADHAPVTKTFSRSFKALAERSPAAADIVRVCAFLAPDAIPEEIFTQGGSELGEGLSSLCDKPYAWTEAIEVAGRFSLIRRNAAAKILSVHRLVQSAQTDEMDADTRLLWSARVVRALDKVFREYSFVDQDVQRQILPHVQIAIHLVKELHFEFEAAGRLLFKTASWMYSREECAESQQLLKRALEIQEKVLGPAHSDSLKTLRSLAESYDYNEFNFAEAESLYQRILATQEKTLGPYHQDTFACLRSLTWFYEQQSRYDEAEPLIKRAIAIIEKAQTSDHSNTMQWKLHLQTTYSLRARSEERSLLYQRALAIRDKVLGLESPNPIGLDFVEEFGYYAHRYQEAMPLFKRALAISQKTLGLDHPETVRRLEELAWFSSRIHRFSGHAEWLFKQVVATREKTLGPDHPDTLQAMEYLADSNQAQLRYLCHSDKSETLYERILSIREKKLGPDHPDSIRSFYDLLWFRRKSHSFGESERLFKSAVTRTEEILGPDHSGTLTNITHLAQFYHENRRYSKAEPLYQRILATMERTLGPDHSDTLTQMTRLADFYIDQARYREGEQLLKRDVAICEKAFGTEHPNTARGYSELARLYFERKRYEEAESLYRSAAAIREKALGPNHVNTMLTLGMLSELLKNTGRRTESEQTLAQVRRIQGLLESECKLWDPDAQKRWDENFRREHSGSERLFDYRKSRSREWLFQIGSAVEENLRIAQCRLCALIRRVAASSRALINGAHSRT
jgi:tetratricopeptide (TPR) repeat protein